MASNTMHPLSRRTLLRSAAATAAVGCGPGDPGTAPDTAPNIVYIYADQHRAPLLGCYGDPDALTPHLDALASESVLFERCFTNAPLCRPARATMMTGQLPHVHGCWSNEQLADRRGESHVRRIRDAGWHTAMIGKAHLDIVEGHADDPVNVGRLEQWGFRSSLELLSQVITVEKPNRYTDWLADTTPQGQRSKASRYRDYVVAWEHLDSPPPDALPTGLGTDDHLDVFCGRAAVDWLAARAGDPQPFYLQINLPGPHTPFDAPSAFRSLYDPARIQPPIPGAHERSGQLVRFLQRTKPELHGLSEADGRFLRMTYLAKISLIDQVVGEIVTALRLLGRLDDTWVIYGSDHGELAGDYELWGKVAMFEGSLRTPLIVRPPGGIVGRRSAALIDQRDVTATLLDIAGQSGPGGGQTLRPAIESGGPIPGREHVVALIEGNPQGGLRTAMIRTDRHKLVHDLSQDHPDELYDLAADPLEADNRIGDPGLTEQIGALRDAMYDELSQA